MSERVVLFTGPSLPPERAKLLLDATILPPIKRGDLAQLHWKPDVIGIIDGEFYQSLAVSPKEILPFLESGTQVYGASSMGALRAVELRHCGMIGIGRVFRLFRSGILDADDEVALAYSPSTYEPVSEPLVNSRYILREARRREILTRVQATKIISQLKAAYFPDRTRQLTVAVCRQVAGTDAAAAIRQFIETDAPNVKQEDAVLLLARIGQKLGIRPGSESFSPSRAPPEFSSGAA